MTDHESQPQSRQGSSDGAPDTTAGGLLRQARDARGLTLEELAGELRIEAKHLLALEENRFRAIGAPVFAKGYLKQYGQRLGLEHQALLAVYEAQVQGQEVTALPKHPIRLRDERQVGLWLLALTTLVVLGGLLIFRSLGLPTAERSPSVAGPAEGAADAIPAAPLADALEPESGVPVDLPPAIGPPAEDPVRAAPETDSPGEMAPADGGVPAVPGSLLAEPPRESAESPVFDGAESGTVAVAASSAPSASPDVPLGTLRVELRFVEDCWTEISDATGARIYYGLGLAGTRAELVASAPIEVLLGNAGAVSMLVDGAPFTIPRTPRQGNLARFTVSSSE